MNDLSFLNEMEKASGQKISGCYQCYRCTVGCPVAKEMDVYPHRVIRYIILGERERVLASKSVWTCLQCVTCSVRCPNDIDIAHVFDTVRKIAMKERRGEEEDTWKFDQYFLNSVEEHGRLYEIEAVLKYKADKKDFFGDTKMGMGMFLKGRLGVLPHNIKGRKELNEIFRKIEAGKARG
jgi:heterodisulfide reductase subunit C2